jgi:2'-5' RNA ligase
MPIAVTLDLNSDDAARVEPLWDALEQNETLLTTRRLGVRPHLSLAVYDAMPPQRLPAQLAGFARRLKPVAIAFANIGIFVNGAATTVFLAPIADRVLLDLHAALHRELVDAIDGCAAHYRPGSWVPHLTLAHDVDRAALPSAIAGLAAVMAPFSGTLDVLSVVRYLPVESLGRYGLDAASG